MNEMHKRVRTESERRRPTRKGRVYEITTADLPLGFPKFPFRRPVRLLGCGDRDWDDWNVIRSVLRIVHRRHGILTLIEGEQRGADLRVRDVGEKIIGLDAKHILGFDADWNQFGPSAGPIRNRKMLKEGRPDLVVAFHDDIWGSSRGTRDMVTVASDAGVPCVVISHSRGRKFAA